MDLFDYAYDKLIANRENLLDAASCRMSHNESVPIEDRQIKALSMALVRTLEDDENANLDQYTEDQISKVCSDVADDFIRNELI